VSEIFDARLLRNVAAISSGKWQDQHSTVYSEYALSSEFQVAGTVQIRLRYLFEKSCLSGTRF
jgi:hypothetical protein